MAEWLNALDDRQKMIITQYERGDDGGLGGTIRSIKAALPENFGISVGSVFTDPFNANVSSNSTVEKVAAKLQVSRKIGARVTSVYYSGPEPTEMSVELEFNAFYSAEQEVMAPIISLMMMAVGTEKGLDDLNAQLKGSSSNFFTETASKWIEQIDSSAAGGIASEIKIIKGPQPCQIKFGNVMTIDSAYISTASPSFSNILDNQFLPMQATCALTIKIQRNPLWSDIFDMFESYQRVT